MKINLNHEYAKIPTRANYWDAGADLYSVESVYIEQGARKLIDTGVAIELPDQYVGLICPRSGLAHKSGLTVLNAPGIIDSTYRGNIKINLINLGTDWVKIEIGDRIAQLVVHPVVFPTFETVDKLTDTSRGSNGHGSSGQ